MPLRLTPEDAMIVATVAVEAVSAIVLEDPPADLLRGAILMFEAVIHRVKPQLPHDAETAFIFEMIAQVERTAASIRDVAGLAPHM